jgi:hypothetical protein
MQLAMTTKKQSKEAGTTGPFDHHNVHHYASFEQLTKVAPAGV